MMAMEIVRPGTSDPDAVATRRIAQACHQAGVIVLTCGSYGNVIRLLPPLVIEEALLADGLSVLDAAVDRILTGAAS
jgi:4-aminobutyrate aminotransferase/(S)-3-amino-2-methylpropionate transaminase